MSIPTVFSTANCKLSSGTVGGGGMAQFCQTYHETPQLDDYCWINTQENYNAWQIGCVNYKRGTFIDNNNNTVKLEFKPEYYPYLDEAIEFPIDSHDNYYFVPAPHYEPPYPVFVSQENCINTARYFGMCCPALPLWSFYEIVPPNGTCALIDESYVKIFGDCCVFDRQGTFINPIDGSTTTPETVDYPFTGIPTFTFNTYTGDASTTGDFWTESSYLATHTESPTVSSSYSDDYENISTESGDQGDHTDSSADSDDSSDDNGNISTGRLDSSTSTSFTSSAIYETITFGSSSNTCTTRCGP